jgi:hypothetical protein
MIITETVPGGALEGLAIPWFTRIGDLPHALKLMR